VSDLEGLIVGLMEEAEAGSDANPVRWWELV
jgi:hypothetical protein